MSESNDRECPKCSGEMEEGFLPGAPHWKTGKGMWGKGHRVFGYRCRNCGYVEFYVKK